MEDLVTYINTPYFTIVAILAAFCLGMAFQTWHSRANDDEIWDEQTLTEEEDTNRILGGFALDDPIIEAAPSYYERPSWSQDSGATAYIQLRDLQEPQRRFHATPIPATPVLEFDPERPTGIPYQSYAPASHRLPENPDTYAYPHLRTLVTTLATDTSQLSVKEIKELVNA